MRWHITGDSFVEGVGATDGNGWAQRFAVAAPPGQVSIVGIGGSDSHDLVDRLPAEVAGHSGGLVFAVGLNDSRRRPSTGRNQTDLETFRANIFRLVQLARARDCDGRVFIIGLTRVDETRTRPFKPDKHYINADIETYDAALRQIADDADRVSYVPVPPLNDCVDNLQDGLHPTDQGHRLLSAAIAPVLLASARADTD